MSVGAPVGRNEIETFYALGKRLRELRHRKGWSQATLASYACVHPDQVSRYELGKETPSLSALAWIADALGCADMTEVMVGVKPEDLIK